MSFCLANQFFQQFLFVPEPQVQLPKFIDKKSPSGFQLRRIYQLHFKDYARFKFSPIAVSSGAASPSPAEYSEQFLGTKSKQKRQKIAGIDQDEVEDPALLADPDSCFCEFKGVQIHHKICDAELSTTNLSGGDASSNFPSNSKKIGFPMILLHGFGASTFSWNRAMKPLAQATGSKVLAFDRPAFGLTSRVDTGIYSSSGSQDARPLNPYSIMFSVLATLYFVDFLAADKVILVGHSAGSLVAVETYFEAPERVAAMVLVAPAIVAPLMTQKSVENNERDGNNKKPEEQSESINYFNLFFRLFKGLSKLTAYIAQSIMRMLKGMGDMINSLYKKALCAFLRSAIGVMLVRMVIDKFGVPAVRNAWYDSKQVTDHVLQGYTKPLRVKGWDKALVEYTIAMLSDSSSQSKPPLSKRLSEISCPVLIVTGDSDRLVPAWNSQRLSKFIPGSCLKIIKNCGHLPHEEKVEEFVSIVREFLHTTIGASEDLQLQAAT
ncbi:hypothetical protein M9H77_10708 [Catharanthus roseus]|uniref:Uncharacterized protein n=1 Tax=Catharanthus roseus TaxID=4058 RepID=A0ACC0BCK6_CATRO|nr:hypothetical protein M9H77_10708 [Catharanthus roseus]